VSFTSYFHPFSILMLFVVFSLNDMMTVTADDDDEEEEEEDDVDNEETASG
jgi:hypothetical protein